MDSKVHWRALDIKDISVLIVLFTLLKHYLEIWVISIPLQWRHNGHDGVSNHQPDDSLLNLSFRRRSKKSSKLRVAGLCEGNSSVTGEFPARRASNMENVSIWWRHHDGTVTATSFIHSENNKFRNIVYQWVPNGIKIWLILKLWQEKEPFITRITNSLYWMALWFNNIIISIIS